MTTLVIFSCGPERCALPRAAVAEVALTPELSQPPGMPASLEGFLNLAGEAVAVVDAAKLFGLSPSAEIDPLYRHVMIVRDGPDVLGLIVDRVEDVRRIDSESIRPAAAADSLNGAVTGDVDLNGKVVHLLAANRILLAAEKARLEDLRQAEQQRLDAMAAT